MIINVVDAHSAGAPCRIVVGGLDTLGISGDTMLDKKRDVETNHGWLRSTLLQEPRGHPALNADLVVPPCDPAADVGLIIVNQRPVYPNMSGGNILCFVSAILEAGVIAIDPDNPITTVRVDTPAGLVTARATCADGRVKQVAVENVPSYATHLNHKLEVPGLGVLTVDVGFGGMFYVLVAAAELDLDMTADAVSEITEAGERVRAAAAADIRVDNPAAPELSSVDAVMAYGPPHDPVNSGRSAVVMPMLPGPPTTGCGTRALIDRCPCGTATCAQLAILHAKGLLREGQPYRQESLIGEVYTARIARTIDDDMPRAPGGDAHGRRAIIPELTGSAHLIAKSEIYVNDDDPLRHGFTVADIWPGRVQP